ncbi:helix-turn-helix domain-containing protein [Cohnella thailandensis]|uniref:Helix-turn-helix domain-containing protein n=1 Tax=Cohnella thailandensis TaxID=557557 RepID=A0A841SW41_9BACL|nr:helix-turn-helix domain-containing protein [Cohnella thailandensis]MBB6636144.1 helix-turn-helix domain-containing protein [Cohnella thailandensis]MBP1973887.1 two-component system response regulator YesN [Cohnella thailandensis]
MRKITVLMVDDEILAMEHMRRLVDWDSLGFVVKDSVSNPKKALSVALELQPDLMIVDIRMPIMSGLELAKSVMEAGLKPRIVLLTSHKEFEYAKEAMKLGIFDYWVKHEMDSDSLTPELNRLRDELRSASTLQDTVRRQLFGELLAHRRLTVEQWRTVAGTMADGQAYRLAVLRPDKPFPVLADTSTGTESPAPNPPEIAGRERDDEFLTLVCSVAIGDALCVLYRESGVSEGRKRERLLAAIERIRSDIQQRNGGTVSVAVSEKLQEWRSLPDAYASALRTLERTVFDGPRITSFVESDSSSFDEARLNWEPSIAELENAARARDFAALDGILVRLFEQAARARDVRGLAECCRQLALILNRMRISSGLPAIDRNWFEAGGIPDDWIRLEGIRDWFRGQFAQRLAAPEGSANYSRKVRQALEHIREHYSEEVTADAIAEKLGISRDHLRHVFKEETGQTVLDALTQVRIEQAKRLLREGRLKIYEIAEKVGYRNSQYFSQVFRKATGRTPLEYVDGRNP